ncbi:TetR/AcrR family transcriptional regulator [Haliovirga abyssi]|uniref:TetR family transcriptional regulator n=1 Tax=Haliovirga abyssi TaxID=2996794 RepID=A0AAU9D6F3_9FUSO|nr:TetR/AcrR family transcriptional regulator [Haliovirga abyssi]BDU51596.1 TetR family transcriptional regulator [Haliovirga abyssi]
MEKELSAKEKLLQVSIKLFAKKGFSATGVRELVKEAGINISMVNYYYNSKVGILKEIITIFYDKLYTEISAAIDKNDNFETRIRKAGRATIKLIKGNEDMFKISIFEFPYEHDDIKEIKKEKVMKIMKLLYGTLFENLSTIKNEKLNLEIAIPAFTGIYFSHFMFKPMLEVVTNTDFNDEFYENYSDYITDIYLYGIMNKLKK